MLRLEAVSPEGRQEPWELLYVALYQICWLICFDTGEWKDGVHRMAQKSRLLLTIFEGSDNGETWTNFRERKSRRVRP